MKLLFVLAFIFSSCISSHKIPRKKYNDRLVTKSENLDGTITYTFIRQGLDYFDIVKKGKLVERKASYQGQLIYKYPVSKLTVDAGSLYLTSGNNYLAVTGKDTLVYLNQSLPSMNRKYLGVGVIFSRLSDSTFIVRPTSNNDGYGKIYVYARHDYSEVTDDYMFISDSLILEIK